MTQTDSDSSNFSFEFFPPRTDEGMVRLENVASQLAELNPRFFSVTYGAGGSTRENTRDTVIRIHQASGIPVAPHLSCIGSTRESLREILDDYIALNIRHIVALRGDPPSGTRDFGDFRFATELVEFIRQETGDHFFIEVACYPEFHPQARNSQADLLHFKEKVDAGADSAITQYFYNIDAYLFFVEECEKLGITIPIIPGIMPINNYQQLARFSDACGAEIPRWIRRRLEHWQDQPDALKQFGLDVVMRLCDDLLDQGAPGLHFYTMNQTQPMLTLWDELDLAHWGTPS
jgi:methylenetetrahydrofolate reductase (NADPH)